MEKRCYVCGHILKDKYYTIGTNSYVCSNPKCYNFYYWDSLATKMINNPYHEYVIVDKKVYQIGSNKDEPLSMDGKFWAIQFNDGTYIETNSLWFKGDLPERLQHDFKDNAKFVSH